jgi:hypothetical protein
LKAAKSPTKDEYKELIEKNMNKFKISYISAIQYITRKQIERFEKKRERERERERERVR